MSKVAVVYWSGTGNTEEMAHLVAEGVRAAGADVSMITAADFTADAMDDFDAIAFGCPAMVSEMLEEDEFQPMFSACRTKLADKRIALFGSYGWGDREWMRNWERDCRTDGAVIAHESVTAHDAPDMDARAACRALGKALV